MKKIYEKVKELYTKYMEVINYLIFGFLTFIVSMVSYYLCRFVFNYILSNIISWIAAVLFAYFTNKYFVFKSETKTKLNALKEFGMFVVSRIFTLILETFVMYIMVDLLKINDMIVKIIAQVIVIVTNYILSKLIIFKKGREKH